MRRVKYQDYLVRRTGTIGEKLKIGRKRSARSRSRSDLERKLLLNLDKARFESWKKAGKIKVIGPRKYKFSLYKSFYS